MGEENNLTCECAMCVRSRRWAATKDKTTLFSEMCDCLANAEFDAEGANHELQRVTEFLAERNLIDNYREWRQL